jgi:hypothetical protein
MRGRRWSTWPGAVVVATLALGGCGGSGGAAPERQGWARAVDRVCADTRRALAAEGRPESLQEAPTVAARNVQVLATGVRRALAVPVPEEARAYAAPLRGALRGFQGQPVPTSGHHDMVTVLEGLAHAVEVAGTGVRAQAVKVRARSCMTGDQLRHVTEPLQTLVFVDRLGDATRAAEAVSAEAAAGLRAARSSARRAGALERLGVRLRRVAGAFGDAPRPAFVRAAATDLAAGLEELSGQAVAIRRAEHGRPFSAARARAAAARVTRLARRQLRRHARVLARVEERYPPVSGAVSGEPPV